MPNQNPYSTLQSMLLLVSQLIEIPLVATVATAAIFTERLPPEYLTTGLLLLLIPSGLRLIGTGRIVAPTLTLFPLLLLGLLCGLTVYVTPSWEYTWPELVRLLAGLGLCLAVINWMNPLGGNHLQPEHGRIPWRFGVGTAALLLLAVGLTAIGLLALQTPAKFLSFLAWDGIEQIRGWAANGAFNPNRVAGVALLGAPLSFALLFGPLKVHEHGVGRWLRWVGTRLIGLGFSTFFVAALLLTQSRGALLAFGCALLLLLPWFGRRGWIALLLVLTLGATAIGVLRADDISTLFMVRDGPTIGTDATNFWLQDRNLRGRWILWQRAVHGIADAPLTGVGLGAFEAISQEPYPQVPDFKPDPDMSHVHNLFLQVGLDLGLPGLLAFVVLLALIAALLFHLIRASRPRSPLRTWSLGLTGSFVAYLLYNMIDALTLGARPSLVVWLLFGLCIGAGEWAGRLQPQGKQLRQPLSVPPSFIPDAPDPVPTMAQSTWEERAWAVTADVTETKRQVRPSE